MDARHRRVAATLGLGCWLATMLLYSNTVTPFQRFAGTALFMGDFAPWSLAMAAVLALATALAALRGRCLPGRALGVLGGAAYVAGAAAFCVLACFGDAWFASLPPAAVGALCACVALGCVGTGLAWGRVYKVLSIRPALTCVAGAALVAAVLGGASVLLPAGAFAALFCAEALAAATLLAVAGMREPGSEAVLTADGLRERPLAERLSSFADVAGPALTGLLAFAFVMGTMRALIVESYGIHLGVLVACACILGVIALGSRRGASAHGALSELIPALAVLQLAASNVTSALWGGSPADMVMIFLLYTLAALLTLGTLAAVAHAGEFPSDLVFSVALLLFCLVSVLGLVCAEAMEPEQIKVSTTLITTAYAFAMVLTSTLRRRRGGRGDDDGGEGVGVRMHDAGGDAGAAAAAAEPTLEERCRACAERFRLTAREGEILTLLACGYDTARIGEELYISRNTVRSHVHNLCRKTGAADREGLVELARRG